MDGFGYGKPFKVLQQYLIHIGKAMENLEINYGAGDIVYFDNVWVREHNLQGKLNGAIVMFVDANL